MEPIDKIIIRAIILLLGSIFGWTAVKNADNLEQVAQSLKGSKVSYNAGFGPALPQKETK